MSFKSTFPILLAATLIVAAILLTFFPDPEERTGKESAQTSSRSLESPEPTDSTTPTRQDRRHSAARKKNPDLPDDVFELSESTSPSAEDVQAKDNFDPERLKELLANPPKRSGELRRLICIAAAKKDPQFLFLLDQEDLRPDYHLEMDAYDFAINGDAEALQRIFETREKEGQGSDSSAVVVLSHLDEWEDFISAVIHHFEKGADGTAASCRRSFWRRRKTYYPEKFERLLCPEQQRLTSLFGDHYRHHRSGPPEV